MGRIATGGILLAVDTATSCLTYHGQLTEGFAYAVAAVSFIGIGCTASRWAESFFTGEAGETAPSPSAE